jgi:uncharacterized cupredoxin-like copper-binding protein
MAQDATPTAKQTSRVVTVRATDYKFDAPASAPAGTISFRLENAGKEVHHLWLVQLKNGKTFEDFVKAMESSGVPRMPEWAVDVGGPNEASPGVSAYATITLEPGRYAMVCYVPSPDGRPHVMKGMVSPFTIVSAGATVANEPKADVLLRMTDYAFDLSKPIEAGPRVIRIENVATQSHEVVIGRLLPGKTLRQALDWLNNGQKGAAPVVAIGGASGLAQGRHQVITATFEKGRYVFLCFIPDAKDGKPHTDHGMAKEFTVTGTSADQ